MSTDTHPIQEVEALFASGDVSRAVALLERRPQDPVNAARLREYWAGEGQAARAREAAHPLSLQGDAEGFVSRSLLALLDGDTSSAISHARSALELAPGLPSAYNHLGRALQNFGQSEAAIDALRQAVEIDSGYAEAWHNLGHVLRAQGQLSSAIEAYGHAVRRAPAYRSAWFNLGVTLFNMEQPEQALEAFERVLASAPGDVEALVHAGLAQQVLGRIQAALERYHQAIRVDPDYATAYTYLGVLLNEQLDSTGAIEALNSALERNPSDLEAWVELASAHEKNNDLYEARRALQQGLRLDPRHPGLRIEKARMERRNGDAASAVATLQDLHPDSLPQRLAQQYFFELGLALDRVDRIDDAMRAFSHGNELVARSIRRRAIDRSAFENRCLEIEAWLDDGAPGGRPEKHDPPDEVGPSLCFLIGFPRSGTTLLDTFLNAHTRVSSIEEMPTLERLVVDLRNRGSGYPASLAGLTARDIEDLRDRYCEEIYRYVDPGTPLILDKLPLRMLHVGLIRRVFPRARILFALRHPCDVVLSNFMQQYAENEAFVHFDSLSDSAAMYDRVFKLWRRIEQTLQPDVHYTRYEDLVVNTLQEIESICDFLGIEAEPEMFDENARLRARAAVRTNSYQQVAEPVYRRAVSRWSRYRSYLEPQLPLLTSHIQRHGYSLNLDLGRAD